MNYITELFESLYWVLADDYDEAGMGCTKYVPHSTIIDSLAVRYDGDRTVISPDNGQVMLHCGIGLWRNYVRAK